MKKRKLKNFLIWPKYQLNHALFTFGSVLLGNSFFAYLTIRNIETVIEKSSINEMSSLKYNLIIFTLENFAASSVVVGLAVVIMNIIHTHRVFGSLFVIEKYLREAVSNNRSEKVLCLRTNDQFGEVVNLINKLLKTDVKADKK